MSKKKSQNRLTRTRLESLFADLEQEPAYLPSSPEQALTGWTWECDADGVYVACSPEVSQVLGIDPVNFLGQPLSRFGLLPESAQTLKAALKSKHFPVEISLHYCKPDDEVLPVIMHIFAVSEMDGKGQGLRGFTQVLPAFEPPAPQPSRPPEPTHEPEPPHLPETPRRPEPPRQPQGPIAAPSWPIYSGVAASGYLAEADQVSPASTILTPAGKESLIQKRLVMQNSLSVDEPAVMALSAPFEEHSSLLLEILDESNTRHWSDDERLLVAQVADQLTLALENAHLFEQSLERAEEMSILRDVSLELAQEQRDLSTMLEILTRRAMELLNSDGGDIWLWRETEQVLELVISKQPSGLGKIGHTLQPNQGLAGRVFSSGYGETVENLTAVRDDAANLDEDPYYSGLAVPLAWQSQVVGVLVVTRSRAGYSYGANEQYLAELLAGQAAAVIQNARLYLEEQRRRQIADTLREIAQVVSSTLDVTEMSERMLEQLSKLIEFQTASIQLIIEGERQLISGRGYNMERQSEHLLRPIEEDKLVSQIVETRQPLLISDTYNDPGWEVQPETRHVRSWIGAPLVVGTEVVGLLIVDHGQTGAYTQETVDLINAVAAQVAIAIQNGRLFKQTQDALAALEVRERYQKSVAQAVTLLTERGTSALSEVMRVLGEAAQASRAYYFETFEADGEFCWRMQNEWLAEGSSGVKHNEALQRLSINRLGAWGDLLKAEGKVASVVQDFPERDRKFLQNLGTKSLLQLAVKGHHEYPGCIGFDQSDYDRVWGADEVAALQTAAAALSNTIMREDLFSQVQVNLAETERLYNASRKLSTAGDISEAVASVVAGVHVPEITRATLILVENNAAGEPMALEFAAQWQSVDDHTPMIPIGTRVNVSDFPTVDLILGTEAQFSEDIHTSERVDPTTKALFEQQQVKAVVALPLWVGTRQVGALLLVGKETHVFTEREKRTYRSLANQIAFVIDNRQLFQKTQDALSETETLYEASRRLTSARDLQEITAAIVEGLQVPAINRCVLQIFEYDSSGEMEEIHIAANWHNGEGAPPTAVGSRYPRVVAKTMPLFTSPTPVFFEDVRNDERVDPQSLVMLTKNNVRAFAVLPLWVGARQLGTLLLQAENTHKFTESETRAFPALMGQVAAAVENRLLFEQTQQALAETEDLYQASARLNLATDFEEILNVLREYTILGHANASNVSLSLFDRPWSGGERPEWYTPIARWADAPYSESPTTRYPMRAWTTAEQLLHPDLPTLVENATNDPRLDKTGRAVYVDELGAKSLVFAPLNVAGKWIGHITSVYQRSIAFSEQDLRRLMSLAGQAAVAIESIRLLNETRVRNEELGALNKIIGAASRSLDLNAMLSEVLEQVLTTINFHAGLIALAHPVTGKLTLALQHGLPDALNETLVEKGMQATLFDLVFRQKRLTYLPDMALTSPIDTSKLVALGLRSYIGVPLESKGKVLGVVCAFGTKPQDSAPGWLSLVQSVGQQVGVAVENSALFEQTQDALSETAVLYEASAELSASRSYDDILASLRKHTLFGHADKLISLTLFDRPWIGEDVPEWNLPVARWTSLPDEALSPRYPLRGNPTAKILSPTSPTIIENIPTDQRIDDELRELYTQDFQGQSTIFVPMVVGGLWIGHISGVFGKHTPFPESEVRRLMSLSGQAAVAVQNLYSIDLAQQRAREAQARSDELSLVNRVVAAVSASLDLKEALQIVVEEMVNTLPIQRSGIALMNENRASLTVMAEHTVVQGIPSSVGITIPIEGNVSTQQVIATRQPIVIADAQIDPRTEAMHEAFVEREIASVVIFPLTVGNTVIGTIGFDINTGGRLLTDEEMRLAGTIVLQSATAIQNARLFDQTQQALAETETLYQASTQINAVQTYDDILSALREHSLLGKSGSYTTINIFDVPWTNTQSPEWILTLARRPGSQAGIENPRYRVQSIPTINSFLRSDQVTIVTDVDNDPRLDEAACAMLSQSFHARSSVFIPLVVAGQWIGYINGVYRSPTEFPDNEVRLMRALSVQAAVAIQNIRLLDESRRRAEQLQTAAEIARDTSSTLALDTLLKRTVNLFLDRFGYYHASIFLLDDEGLNAVVRESSGEAGEEMKRRGHKLAVGSRSVMGIVTGTGKPLIINDVTQDPNHRPNPLLPSTRAELGIPLKIGARVIGALDVQATQINTFTQDDVSVLQILADQVAVAVDNARSYEISQKAVEEMREVDRLKSQFLANMSHELRTPLNSIIGFSRVILKGIDGPISDLQQQDLSAIYNSGQHLLKLINDILDLSKIEAGKMELSFEDDVNLNDLINSVMSTMMGLVKDKPVKLLRDVAPDLPNIRADSTKVRQVIINLLSNAAKFTDEGTITIEANTQKRTDGQTEIIVRVIDTGAGISLEDQKKLFQPFSQVDGSLTRKTGGTGLGLSITRHLIEMHGGRIDLISEVGKGSTFYFTLPVPISEIPNITTNEKVILAIDDERQVINLYERYLANHGYKVVALTDPKEAVARARELMPYAITLDIMMPECDGWQVLEEIKKNPDTQHIPVIICSILEDQEKGFSLGATDYLMKPILEEDLVQAIDRLNGNGDIHEVLAVDDDPNDLRLIEKIFKDHPEYKISLAQGGNQALVSIRYKRPDAIILDLFMPDLDGFTILETLRADPILRDIPVIIFTAGDLTEDQQAKLSEFSQSMVRKGLINEEELLSILERSLSRMHPIEKKSSVSQPGANDVTEENSGEDQSSDGSLQTPSESV